MLMRIKVELNGDTVEFDVLRTAQAGAGTFEHEGVYYKLGGKTPKKIFEQLKQENFLFTKTWPKELELYLVNNKTFYVRTVPQIGDYGIRRWFKPQLISREPYVRYLPKHSSRGQYVFGGRLRDRKIVSCVEGPLRERVKAFADQYGCTFEALPEVGRAVTYTTAAAWARTTAY